MAVYTIRNTVETEKVPTNWDEQEYIRLNPDVSVLISDGKYRSGYHHFVTVGVFEGLAPTWADDADSNNDIWSEHLYFGANPDLKSLQSIGISGREHFESRGQSEKRVSGLDKFIAEYCAESGIPEWCASEMLSQAGYDPSLDFVNSPHPTPYNPFRFASHSESIGKIASMFRSDRYDFLFLVPWLRKGGADAAALFHMTSVADAGKSGAVILTEDDGKASEWLDRVPDSFDVVPAGAVFAQLSDESAMLVMYHLFSAIQIEKIHVINSEIAWKLLRYNGLAISQSADLFVSLYCYDYRESGEPVGYARYISEVSASISGIFTDNSVFANHLTDDCGVSREKVCVLRHPVRDMQRPVRTIGSNKVLWAGRLDRQKQPELIAKIAKRLPGLEFHVYGSAILGNGDELIRSWELIPNVFYHGPFGRFDELMERSYCCFLNTSLWDGLPNIVLEAMAAGMLVVSSDVGGLRADLGDEVIVFVSKYSNEVDEYVDKIRWSLENFAKAQSMRIAGQEHVLNRHTKKGFEESLKAFGYFESGPKRKKAARARGKK